MLKIVDQVQRIIKKSLGYCVKTMGLIDSMLPKSELIRLNGRGLNRLPNGLYETTGPLRTILEDRAFWMLTATTAPSVLHKFQGANPYAAMAIVAGASLGYLFNRLVWAPDFSIRQERDIYGGSYDRRAFSFAVSNQELNPQNAEVMIKDRLDARRLMKYYGDNHFSVFFNSAVVVAECGYAGGVLVGASLFAGDTGNILADNFPHTVNILKHSFLGWVLCVSANNLLQQSRYEKVVNEKWSIVPVLVDDDNMPAPKGPPDLNPI